MKTTLMPRLWNGVVLACLIGATTSGGETDGMVRWQIAKSDSGWQLTRNGEPFYIQGAVGWNRFDVLRQCGGNAVRAPAKQATLDAAQREGLAVMANLPVRGERNGMDWGNPEQVAEQQREVLAVVRQLKDHPALMFWAVGNELDHIPGGEPYHPQLWQRLNDLAIAIKQIDPNHPVMTVVGTGRYEQKIQQIAAACRRHGSAGRQCLRRSPFGDRTDSQVLAETLRDRRMGTDRALAGAEDQVACAAGTNQQREGTGHRRAIPEHHPRRQDALPRFIRTAK